MSDLTPILDLIHAHSKTALQQRPEYALPDPSDVARARGELFLNLPDEGVPLEQLADHVLSLCKGLSNSSLASTYYGFITGGTTPQARVAELLASLYDQNVAAHLPEQSIVTDVEERALVLLQHLLRFDPFTWRGRTLTTGATAGNIQGLAIGREAIINRRLPEGSTSGELGLLAACKLAGIVEIKLLSSGPHSSLLKAASVVGLGRSSYIDVRKPEQDQTQFAIDHRRLETELSVAGRACIVAVSCGEVNTGSFATSGAAEMIQIRELCDKYNAWLHVDGAFGLFARLLEGRGDSYRRIASGAQGVEVADSIASDLHKFLNVPYDCGFFMCQDANAASLVYMNPNAVYLKPGNLDLPSPLNMRAENSTRFRGFAVYSSLIGIGEKGYTDILRTQIGLARDIARYIDQHEALQLLNRTSSSADGDYEQVFMIVLFKAKSPSLNSELATAINAQRKIFVSGTEWAGEPACRIAISNWQARREDLLVVQETAAHISVAAAAAAAAALSEVAPLNP